MFGMGKKKVEPKYLTIDGKKINLDQVDLFEPKDGMVYIKMKSGMKVSGSYTKKLKDYLEAREV